MHGLSETGPSLFRLNLIIGWIDSKYTVGKPSVGSRFGRSNKYNNISVAKYQTRCRLISFGTKNIRFVWTHRRIFLYLKNALLVILSKTSGTLAAILRL